MYREADRLGEIMRLSERTWRIVNIDYGYVVYLHDQQKLGLMYEDNEHNCTTAFGGAYKVVALPLSTPRELKKRVGQELRNLVT